MAEKRLISYDVLMKHLDSCIKEGKGLVKSICVAIKCFVEQMPAVDAVEAVYCRDCKHFDAGDEFNRPLCTHLNGLKTAHESLYCPFGERRTDNETEQSKA